MESLRSPRSSLVVLRGPPGVGKTHGACEAARFCGRRCVFVPCAEMAATNRNREELSSELAVAVTRRSAEDVRDARPPVLVLDDVETLPQLLVSQLVSFLRSAHDMKKCQVIMTCGRQAPKWLAALSCTTLYVSPLLNNELKAVARTHGVPLPCSHTATEDCLWACAGDARHFLNELRLHAVSEAAHALAANVRHDLLETQLNEWAAAAHLLHTRVCGLEGVGRLVAPQQYSLLAGILHANYVDALVEGRKASFADEAFADDFCRRVDRFAEADAMHPSSTAGIFLPVDEGVTLLASVAMGTGRKAAKPPKLRHSLPPRPDALSKRPTGVLGIREALNAVR